MANKGISQVLGKLNFFLKTKQDILLAETSGEGRMCFFESGILMEYLFL